MEIFQISNHSILLAPSYLHPLLRKQLLATTKGRIGIQITSLDAFLTDKDEESLEELEVLLKYRQIITTLPIHIYTSITSRLDFLKQCADFIKEMKFYQIELSDLPRNTPSQQELVMILSHLFPIKDAQDQQNAYREKLKDTSFTNVYVYDFFHDEKEEVLLQWLYEKGAHRIPQEECYNEKHFYHAINKRKEVEAFAQYIITHQILAENVSISVCDPSYKALISQVFHRYHIPLTILKQKKASMITKRFVSLFEYFLEPTMDVLLKLLDTNVFSFAYLHDFIEYIQVFQPDIHTSFQHIKEHASPSELIDERELRRLLILEEHAEACRLEILPYLQRLLATSTMQETFQLIHEIATLNLFKTDTKAIQVIKKIHQQLLLLEPYMKTKEDCIFVMDVLSQVQESANGVHVQGVLITDLQAPLPPRALHAYLGCTQNNFPAIPIKNNIFDETYVSTISKYPKRKERYDLFMAQTQHFIKTNPCIYASYPLGAYDGKGSEASLEMEAFMIAKATSYPLIENYVPYQDKMTITKETAQQLFVKDHIVSGSISSLERYQQCPFAYFLKYGLRLHEPIDYQFSQSRIGTLSHYVFENLTDKYGKQYVETSIEEIDSILTKELQTMANVYPSFQVQLSLIKKRMLVSIEKNIQYLKEMEGHASTRPYVSEYEFWHDFIIDDETTLKLHGFIDRIDVSNDFIRILDYKSSSKSLSVQDVFAGLQLQLITYALVAQKELQKNVLGVYYYSLKNENISIGAGKMKRRPVMYNPQSIEDYHQQWLSSKKLKGWPMSELVEVLDDDGSHIYGLRQNKDGDIVARNIFELSVVQEHFQKMYQKIGTSLLHGNIACNPTKDACMFCPYARICRFHVYPRIAQPLVEIDETIYKGGGGNDANME